MTRPLTAALLLAAVAAVAAGCAGLAPRSEPLPLPPQRVAMAGLSLLPPHEAGWVRLRGETAGLALERYRTGSDEVYAIDARPIELKRAATMEDFTKEVGAVNARWLLPARYQLRRYEQAADPTKGAKCVRAQVVVDDAEAVRRSTGATAPMTLEVLTLTCTLPGSVSRGVSVTYSYRHLPDAPDPQFSRRAAALLDSVVLKAD